MLIIVYTISFRKILRLTHLGNKKQQLYSPSSMQEPASNKFHTSITGLLGGNIKKSSFKIWKNLGAGSIVIEDGI